MIWHAGEQLRVEDLQKRKDHRRLALEMEKHQATDGHQVAGRS